MNVLLECKLIELVREMYAWVILIDFMIQTSRAVKEQHR
jgi:hypothetical protein